MTAGTRVEIAEADADDDTYREYVIIRDAFRHLLWNWDNSAGRRELIEEIVTLRASFLISRALEGLHMDFDTALDLLRNFNDFTSERERQQREVLVAAVDNLVDFALAEEFALLEELPDTPAEEEFELCESIAERYNLVYARQENDEVLFAASVAAWWLTVDTHSIVTYMTQGDERVRPWHLSLEGISYPKREFPAELIPPIEWGCRCFLVADGTASVRAALTPQQAPKLVDPVFRESLARGGRIFSPAHRYFGVPIPKEERTIASRLKRKFGIHANHP